MKQPFLVSLKSKYVIVVMLAFSCFTLPAQYYFPPAQNTGIWDTVSPAQLNWCATELDTLDDYLAQANTKSFVILHKGKIAVEWYYAGFSQDSAWYWASAAKSLKAFMIGQLQEDGLLNINDKTSDYLGAGWTISAAAKEDLITVKTQLSMSTGLDYQVPNLDCTEDTCLKYKADAGTQWYYHNAPYILLTDVLENASGKTINAFTFQNVLQPIGMQGVWLNKFFFSTARSMARFGLLNLNNGVWNGTTLLGDQAYLSAMKNSSQNLNPAYGYLWWLNGKNDFIQPGLPNTFQGAIVPSAPADMYMAAGKNDQRIYIVPSLDVIVVRQGDAANQSLLAISGFDTELWNLLSNLICTTISLDESSTEKGLHIYPNPVANTLHVTSIAGQKVKIYNANGEFMLESEKPLIDVSTLSAGIYVLQSGNFSETFVKQ